MGQDDNLTASLAHIILGCVAGNGIKGMSGKSFTHPGMHANFFIHSILGFLHYQSKLSIIMIISHSLLSPAVGIDLSLVE